MCNEQMISVVATMLDTGSVQAAQDAWGMPSPATDFAVQLWAMLTTVRLREGVPVAVEQLTEMAAVGCFDGDIANDVTRTELGDGAFVSACLDGIVPQPGAPVCDVTQQAPNDPDVAVPAPATSPTAVESIPASSEPDVPTESLLNFPDGVPPWDLSVSAEEAGVVDLVQQIRRDPDLATCPVLWPTDERVTSDGTGEGGPGFANWGLEIAVPTPGGYDFGGAALWRDGLEPFDTAFSPESLLETEILASGDELTIAYSEYNVARIETPAGCIWEFGASTGYGLEVVLNSLRSVG